jgi:hypothetical protein
MNLKKNEQEDIVPNSVYRVNFFLLLEPKAFFKKENFKSVHACNSGYSE